MSRRTVLLAAAPALLLAGCGSNTPEDQQADPNVDLGVQRQGDVDLLNQLLEVEDGRDGRRSLAGAVRELGGQPTAAEPETADPVAAYATYLDVIPKLADGRLREGAAGLLAEPARRIARQRAQAGEPPAPEAFVG